MDRWLPFVGILLLLEAALGFLPHLRQTGATAAIPQIAGAVCAAAAGGAAWIASRNRSFTVVRAFLWTAFGAIGVMHLAGYASFAQADRFMWSSYFLFGNASWTLFGVGVPLLWGSALARGQDPANPQTQKLGRISAGLVQLGFIFMFVSEIRMWGMFGSMGSGAAGFAAAYGLSQVVQTVDRVLLLWSSVTSVRTAVDEETIRRRAAQVNRLMLWWLGLALVSSVLQQLAMDYGGGGASLRASLPYFVRVLIYQTLAFGASLAVFLHFQSKRAGDNSEAPAGSMV